MSITSFPRLPEDEARKGDHDDCLSDQDADPDGFLKSARLQRIPSSASDLASHDVSPLQETSVDPLAEGCACQRDGLTVIVSACLTFATGVTIALIVQIYFGDPQIFNQGAVVTDVSQCTSLGLEVLARQGSSVDAAIAAALCLGVIHPQTSGIGGGGVMLVHDIRNNDSRVIDFRETAPSSLSEEMLDASLELRPGLMVGVPGLLSGLNQAHQLYGRLPWKDVVTLAADVARNGFNVTHDLAEALAAAMNQNMSEAFMRKFLPNGQPPLSGLFARRPDLAAILDEVASKGISEFYSGNLTEEMVAAVTASGGVLSESDFANYSTALRRPAEVVYQEHQVMTAPAPHAGVALITALNILEGYNITNQVPRNSTFHWVAEAVKIALALASGLGDPMFNGTVGQLVSEMLSKTEAARLREMINDTRAFPAGHYASSFGLEEEGMASQVMVMGPDDFIVSVMGSMNKPFGSGILTASGILLNSQVLAFSWPNKAQAWQHNPHNNVQPRKRPMSFLMPTVVRPALGMCGTYVALGSSNGERALSSITQVLMNVLSSRKNLSDSLTYGRLHAQLQPNTLLVDSDFPDEDVVVLQAKGHQVERTGVLSLVEGARRTNDLIIGVKDPRSRDASALTMATNLP